MFQSCVCVCLSIKRERRGVHLTITHDALNLPLQGAPALAEPLSTGTPSSQPPSHPQFQTMLVISGGQDQRPFQNCSLEEPPGAGYWSKYDWRAGGTHPTGMLSCYEIVFRSQLPIPTPTLMIEVNIQTGNFFNKSWYNTSSTVQRSQDSWYFPVWLKIGILEKS